MASLRRQHLLILRREDHKHDALGAIFLGVVTGEKEVRAYVERYLGPQIPVRSIQAEEAVLRVTVETGGFPTESQNLVRMGRGANDRGRIRAAADLFAEALKLDPMNVDAWKGQAAILLQKNELGGAEEAFVRAGEIRGYDGEILRGLAAIALREERRPTAMAYLEEALLANADDVEAREVLDELRRQTELRFADPPRRDGGGEP